MTRINLGIEPRELCDKHLVAEYHELPRIVTMVAARVSRGATLSPSPKGLPQFFTLGRGHMLYFCTYLGTIQERYDALCQEMRHRNFTVNFGGRLPAVVCSHTNLYRVCPPDHVAHARQLLIPRLLSRLPSDPRWTARRPPEWVFRKAP